MSRYPIINEIENMLQPQKNGKLVRAYFDYEEIELVFETNIKTIASEFKPDWFHKLTVIDETFGSFKVFNKLFNGKIKSIVAYPTDGWVTDKKFENPNYKCIYDKDGKIRQDIIEQIEYYFIIPKDFNLKGLNGVKISDGVDEENPYTISVLNTKS